MRRTRISAFMAIFFVLVKIAAAANAAPDPGFKNDTGTGGYCAPANYLVTTSDYISSSAIEMPAIIIRDTGPGNVLSQPAISTNANAIMVVNYELTGPQPNRLCNCNYVDYIITAANTDHASAAPAYSLLPVKVQRE